MLTTNRGKQVVRLSWRGRHWITLGSIPRRDAWASHNHIEMLAEAAELGCPPPGDTRRWLEGIPEQLRQRLAGLGLCEPGVGAGSVAALVDDYLERASGRCGADTVAIYRRTTDDLLERWGSLAVDQVTPADVQDWCESLAVAPTTAGKRQQVLASVLMLARRQRLISVEDYHELIAAMPRRPRTNPQRRHWVDPEDVRRAIEHTPSAEQRLIFALARWGGLRIPSELVGLSWQDVDWQAETIGVRSPKQSRHAERATRRIPIWPEIRPHLESQWDAAGTNPCIILQHRSRNTAAHRKLFLRACRRAGMIRSIEQSPWPKLWVNMRSTRATELRGDYPNGAVNYWLNHTEAVSVSHYQQWEHYDWRISKS